MAQASESSGFMPFRRRIGGCRLTYGDEAIPNFLRGLPGREVSCRIAGSEFDTHSYAPPPARLAHAFLNAFFTLDYYRTLRLAVVQCQSIAMALR